MVCTADQIVQMIFNGDMNVRRKNTIIHMINHIYNHIIRHIYNLIHLVVLKLIYIRLGGELMNFQNEAII